MMLLRAASMLLPSKHSSLSDTYVASTGATALCFEPSALELPTDLICILKDLDAIQFSGSAFTITRGEPKSS